MSDTPKTPFFKIAAAFGNSSLLLSDSRNQSFILEPEEGREGKYVLKDGASFDWHRIRMVGLRAIFEELFGSNGKKGKTESPVAIAESTRVSEDVARLIARYLQLKGKCTTFRDAIAQETSSTYRFQEALRNLEKDMEEVVAALREKIETLDEFELA